VAEAALKVIWSFQAGSGGVLDATVRHFNEFGARNDRPRRLRRKPIAAIWTGFLLGRLTEAAHTSGGGRVFTRQLQTAPPEFDSGGV